MSGSWSVPSLALRLLFTLGILALGLLSGAPANADSYPSHPIRVIVPLAPGGATDALARQISARLSQKLGQTVVVENKSGANTAIGASFVAKSAPDGYTLLFINGATIVINPLLFSTLPYKPSRDFVPVAPVAFLDLTLTVSNDLPVNNLKEFVEYTKVHSGKISYGSSGVGSQLHLMGEIYKKLTGTDITHVPYRGIGPALPDLLGGRILFTFPSVATVQGFLEGDRLKVLAISGNHRSPILPNVPTFTEAGFNDMDVGAWYGFVAPAGTPKDIIAKLNETITSVLNDADMKKDFIRQGMQTLTQTPEQFADFIRNDSERVARLIKTAGLTVE